MAVPSCSRGCFLSSPAPLTLILGISEEGRLAAQNKLLNTETLSEAVLPGVLLVSLPISGLHLLGRGEGLWAGLLRVLGPDCSEEINGCWGKEGVLGEWGTCPCRELESQRTKDNWAPASP